MTIDKDEIENLCCDLKNALSDLLDNGPNDDDEQRVRNHLGQLDLMMLDLIAEPEEDKP